MSVIGYNSNEMATFHLVKTYCVPTSMYNDHFCAVNKVQIKRKISI